MLPGYLLDLESGDYDAVRALQLRLVAARVARTIPDTIIQAEHNPVITLGRRADERHVLASPDTLAQLGIAIRRVERGGDVTYHGPGQVVAYPIILLANHGLGVGDYMHMLEQVIIDALSDLGLPAHRRQGLIGVWVGHSKIAALGVRVQQGVTFHGLAVNVDPDTAHWATIIPCGITDAGVTSLAKEMRPCPPMSVVRSVLAGHLATALGLDLFPISPQALERVLAGTEAVSVP